MPFLNDWSVISSGTPYTAPEVTYGCLSGTLTEDFRNFHAGAKIKTSRIMTLDLIQMVATTKKGTIYSLGIISQTWLDWLKENNLKIEDYQLDP